MSKPLSDEQIARLMLLDRVLVKGKWHKAWYVCKLTNGELSWLSGGTGAISFYEIQNAYEVAISSAPGIWTSYGNEPIETLTRNFTEAWPAVITFEGN